jgi:PAS domain S-box-containing protein
MSIISITRSGEARDPRCGRSIEGSSRSTTIGKDRNSMTENLRRALVVLLMTGIFILDIAIPLGVAVGVLHVAAVLVALTLSHRRETIFFTVACSVLVLAGLLIHQIPGGADLWKALANEVLALAAIWATAGIGLRRKRDFEALRSSMARNQAILEVADDGILTIDEEGGIESVNPAARDIFGYTSEELIGQEFKRLLIFDSKGNHPENSESFPTQSGDGEAVTGLTPQELLNTPRRELVGRRRDGSRFPMEVTVAEASALGRHFFAGLVRNISKRKKAQAALASQIQREKVITRLGLRALEGVGSETLIQESLEALTATLGMKHAEFLELLSDGHTLRLVAGAGWRSELVGSVTLSANRGSLAGLALHSEYPVIVDDLPSEARFEAPAFMLDHGVVSGMSVMVRGGEQPYGVLGVHDQQSRSFAEEDVLFFQSVANLVALALRRQRTDEALLASKKRARASEQLATVGEFASGLAHEIGTPMNIILGYARMLEKVLVKEKNREQARIIGEQTMRVTKLIKTLLNFSRMRPTRRVPVVLSEVVEESLGFVKEKLRNHGIEVERDFAPVPLIRADPEKLEQLFLNLFVNAIDAMPSGGVLRTSIAAAGAMDVEIRVADTGTGIEPGLIDKIFEPFHTTKAAGKGSGLGLAVSENIVLEHDGRIDVTSRVGQGTEFRIRFRRDVEGEWTVGL